MSRAWPTASLSPPDSSDACVLACFWAGDDAHGDPRAWWHHVGRAPGLSEASVGDHRATQGSLPRVHGVLWTSQPRLSRVLSGDESRRHQVSRMQVGFQKDPQPFLGTFAVVRRRSSTSFAPTWRARDSSGGLFPRARRPGLPKVLPPGWQEFRQARPQPPVTASMRPYAPCAGRRRCQRKTAKARSCSSGRCSTHPSGSSAWESGPRPSPSPHRDRGRSCCGTWRRAGARRPC